MISPILIFIFQNAGIDPWVSFGIFGILAGGTSLFMKETFGLPLENEIEEEKSKINGNSLTFETLKLNQVSPR